MRQPEHHPGGLPQHQNQADYNGNLVHQHQHLSQDVADPVHQSGQHGGGHLSNNQTESTFQLFRKVDAMKAEYQEVVEENAEALREYAELDKSSQETDQGSQRSTSQTHKDLL